MSDYMENGAEPVVDAAVDNPPTIDQVEIFRASPVATCDYPHASNEEDVRDRSRLQPT